MTALVLGLSASASAEELRIGLAAGPTSFDPHYHAHAPSYALHRHVFEPLITRAADMGLEPTLAQRWVPLAEGDGWEFHLDPAARFQDGTAVTAADVVASLRRAQTLPNSPARWTPFLADIASVEIVDARTLRMRARGPAPLMPSNLTTLLIVPARLAEAATTSDFNLGAAAIGSGPYRLSHYVPGTSVDFAADASWWQAPRRGVEPWAKVAMQVVTNDASRVAALLARDLDLIDGVPPNSARSIANRAGIRIVRSSSGRVVYVALDQHAVLQSGMTDRRGAPLARNPLADIRVRRALSLAIDRQAVVSQIMDGQATVANQPQPDGLSANDPTIPPAAHDPVEARRLLIESGWGEGFRMVLGGPNNRLVNDERILQAVAQMWEKVGVSIDVQAQPMSVYLPRFTAGAYPSALASWVNPTQDPNSFFSAILATRNTAQGRGVYNPTGYSNPVLDRLLDQALGTAAPELRARIWQRAARIALVDDVALLPLHHQMGLWGMRSGLGYVARSDEATYAMAARNLRPR